jgi:hypothetical protein
MWTRIRHVHRRSGCRVVSVPPVGKSLRLARANSAHFNESKILIKALFWSPRPEAPHLRIRRDALSSSNVIPTGKRPTQEYLLHTSFNFAA